MLTVSYEARGISWMSPDPLLMGGVSAREYFWHAYRSMHSKPPWNCAQPHHSAGLGSLNAWGVLHSDLKNVTDRHATLVETCFRLIHDRESAKKERDETVWNLSRPQDWQSPFSLCRPPLLFHWCSKVRHFGRVHLFIYSCTDTYKWLHGHKFGTGKEGA